MRELAILFGAGASHGAGGVLPEPPPLGDGIYSKLLDRCPRWKPIPMKARDMHDLFEHDFESGMADLWVTSFPLKNEILVAMGAFFAEFEPPSDQTDLYSRLLRFANSESIVDRLGIATLNYECVLERAAERCGIEVAYEMADLTPDRLLV